MNGGRVSSTNARAHPNATQGPTRALIASQRAAHPSPFGLEEHLLLLHLAILELVRVYRSLCGGTGTECACVSPLRIAPREGDSRMRARNRERGSKGGQGGRMRHSRIFAELTLAPSTSKRQKLGVLAGLLLLYDPDADPGLTKSLSSYAYVLNSCVCPLTRMSTSICRWIMPRDWMSPHGITVWPCMSPNLSSPIFTICKAPHAPADEERRRRNVEEGRANGTMRDRSAC